MTTNWHPTEEDLVLHFYGETDAPLTRRVEDHLHQCSSCRAAWTELGETLKLVDQAQAAVPEPGPGFERVMWARVQQDLKADLKVSRTKPSVWSVRMLLPIAATLMVTAIGGAVAWKMSHRATSPATAPQVAAVAPTAAAPAKDSKLGERVLLTALDDHFQQAQMLLVELKNSPEDAGDFDLERATADDIISSGRLYRVAARQQGERRFVQMIDELEAALLDVARSENGVRPEALKALRARIESQDLLFKVRVATKQVQERQKDLLTAAANE